MKISIYFRDRLDGTAESLPSGEIGTSGDVSDLINFYRSQTNGKLHGDDLLRYILDRLHGNTWAEEVKPGELPGLLRAESRGEDTKRWKGN